MRETETIITFEIAGEQYTMFVEGILKKKYYLSKENKGSMLADPIPVKIVASTISRKLIFKKTAGFGCLLSVGAALLAPYICRYGILSVFSRIGIGIVASALICLGIKLILDDE